MAETDELMDDEVLAAEAEADIGAGEAEVADVEEASAEEPLVPEAADSPIILNIDTDPSLASLVVGDRVVLAVDTVNEDGTIGMSVFDTVTGEEGALEAGAEDASIGREDVLGALQR